MIRAERTPNPNSLKFTATGEQQFTADEILAISSEESAGQHPLGERLLTVDGVADVFITPSFVTVSKEAGAEWDQLKSTVEDVLTDYLEGQN